MLPLMVVLISTVKERDWRREVDHQWWQIENLVTNVPKRLLVYWYWPPFPPQANTLDKGWVGGAVAPKILALPKLGWPRIRGGVMRQLVWNITGMGSVVTFQVGLQWNKNVSTLFLLVVVGVIVISAYNKMQIIIKSYFPDLSKGNSKLMTKIRPWKWKLNPFPFREYFLIVVKSHMSLLKRMGLRKWTIQIDLYPCVDFEI